MPQLDLEKKALAARGPVIQLEDVEDRAHSSERRDKVPSLRESRLPVKIEGKMVGGVGAEVRGLTGAEPETQPEDGPKDKEWGEKKRKLTVKVDY